MPVVQALIGFLFCSAAIVYAGSRLSQDGDRIAGLTGLGGAWIGFVLMAAVTSLPELLTGISAVSVVKAPNLAAGDVFGSCIFNLLILSVLDALQKKPITSMVSSTHVFAGACSIILIVISGLGILRAGTIPVIGWFSLTSPVLILVYVVFTRLLYRVEAREPAGVVKASAGNYSLGKTLLRFAMNAGLVVLAAFFLPYFGRHLAEYSGWGTTFFGTLFLAASTSMPELVVSVASLRRGSLDLAVGNLFGSNIFNIVILAVDDFFYRDGPLFARINPEHMVSILVVVMMTAVASAGLLFKSGRKRFVLAADTFIILLLYIGLMIDLYLTR